MPFINDVLESNKEQNETARRKESVNNGVVSRFLFEPDKVFASLSAKIVGQENSLQAIHDVLHVVKADFSSGQRPLSVMLFVGSTG